MYQVAIFVVMTTLGTAMPQGWQQCAAPSVSSGAFLGVLEAALCQTSEMVTQKDVPFRDCVVVAASSGDDRVLMVKRVSENLARAQVVEADGKVEKQLDFAYPWKRGTADLSRQKSVLQLKKDYHLKSVEKGELEPDKRAMVSLQYEPKQKRVVLVTSNGERELEVFSRKDGLKLRVSWRRDGEKLYLSGGTGTQGFFRTINVPKGGALETATIRNIYLKEAELYLAELRYRRAATQVEKSLEYGSTARAYYFLAWAQGYRQNWAESRSARKQLRKMSGAEAKELAEKLDRNELMREALVRDIDLNRGRGYSFKASKGFEGTSVWVKVKDADGTTIAAFKPTNGNTYHRGEVFAYRMSKLLGIEALFPVTILYELDRSGCDRLTKSLRKVKYKGMKEKNRRRMIRKCRKHHKLEGAVKEWVHGFQFFGAIGKKKKLKRHSIYRNITRKGAWPKKGDMVKARQVTRLYKPDRCKKATYLGKLDRWQFARDLSDIMIMDVLMSNEDRFPGANIDFKTTTRTKEPKDCVFDFGESRLFSLDNGATFKGTYSNGLVDFRKRVKVSRFRKDTYRKLKMLQLFIDGKRRSPTFLRRWGIHSKEELWKFLALDKGDNHKRRKHPHKLFITNLNNVLKYIEKYVNDQYAWFD